MNKFAIFLVLGLIGSSARGANPAPDRTLLATCYPIYLMARNVAGEVPGIKVELLAPPTTGCPHDYGLTPDDMKKLAHADLLVANGAGLETFLAQALATVPNLEVVRLADGLPLIKDNPHLWVSPSLAIQEVRNLGRFLETWDPSRAARYRENAAGYTDKLEKLRDRMRTELAGAKGKKIVTFHEAFPYFAQEFGLEIAAVVEREPGSEPGAREMAETITRIKKSGVQAVFREPQYPAAAAEIIAREAGVGVYALDPAVTGPDEAGAYLAIMEGNLEVLRQALK